MLECEIKIRRDTNLDDLSLISPVVVSNCFARANIAAIAINEVSSSQALELQQHGEQRSMTYPYQRRSRVQ